MSPTLTQVKAPEPNSSSSILDFIKNKKAQVEVNEASAPKTEALTRVNQQRPDLSTTYKFFEDEDRNIWSGFVTRNKQHRVLMEAYVVGDVHGDSSVLERASQYLSDQDHNLNVSHRTNCEDVMRHPPQGVVAFIPQNNTQERQFQEYIDYFTQKQRVGLCFLRNGVMFLMPPSETSRQFFETDRPIHMVGVFGDAQASAAQSARFSGQSNNNSNMIK